MSIQAIRNNAAQATVDIVLQDGAGRTLTHAALRAACRCADCTALRRAGGQPYVDGGIRLLAIEPVGAYGVQLIFSDRHDRGIYPWPYLEKLAATPP
ncbi:DUF971 domain-containing protein [Pseudoduganella sp. LjRoot289]|uniref:gamma-butyrobetaine hydroxylase-like domain-containing protein n=1 Tax=Pseudoduganella sp. LjRoot289 TaxID=3342314 RepID=UPI003ED0AA37